MSLKMVIDDSVGKIRRILCVARMPIALKMLFVNVCMSTCV